MDELHKIQRVVVGAFMFSSDHKLLMVKNAKGGIYQNYWLVPGGGVEEGETFHQAVIREVLEEVNVDIASEKLVLSDIPSMGASEKVLPETQEKVVVHMTFHDFKIELSEISTDLEIVLNEELQEFAWFSAAELPVNEINTVTYNNIVKWGFVAY